MDYVRSLNICVCACFQAERQPFTSIIFFFEDTMGSMKFLNEVLLGCQSPGARQHCYKKKAATVGQNGRLSVLCNFFSF